MGDLLRLRGCKNLVYKEIWLRLADSKVLGHEGQLSGEGIRDVQGAG